MARRLHDLSEASDNLVRLRGEGTNYNGQLPRSFIGQLLGLGRYVTKRGLWFVGAAVLLVSVLVVAFVALGRNDSVPSMTVKQAFAVFRLSQQDPDTVTSEVFRNWLAGTVVIDQQVRACSDVWPEFSFRTTSTLVAATRIVGETRKLLTQEASDQLNVAIRAMEAQRKSKPLSSPEDYQQCLLTSQAYKVLDAQIQQAMSRA